MNADSYPVAPPDSAGQSGVAPGTLHDTRLFQRTDWLSFAVTTLLALAVYLLTLAPDVGLVDDGHFSVSAMYAGVPDNPGYPLWTLWAWAFTKLLPFSNIARRAAESSAVAGALACGVVALMVSRSGVSILEHVQGNPRLSSREGKWLRAVCGCSSGMVFGLNGAFWPRAVIAAPWPLSILLLCLVLCLLQRWSYTHECKRYLYGAAFVYGLTLTNSQIELAFAPAIPFLVLAGNQKIGRDMLLAGSFLFLIGLAGTLVGIFPLLRDYGGGLFFIFILLGVLVSLTAIGSAMKTRQLFSEWKAVLICCSLFLLGLAVYFFLPIASMTNPPMNWGYPRTVEGFFHVLSRGQYERMHATDDVARFLEQVRMYFALAGKEFGWSSLLMAAVPFCFLRRMAPSERRWILGLLAAYVCLAFLMLAVLNPASDMQSLKLIRVYFSASYAVLALWMGCGLIILGSLMTKPTRPKRSPVP